MSNAQSLALARALNAALGASRMGKTVQDRRLAKARAFALEDAEAICRTATQPYAVINGHVRRLQVMADELERMGVAKSEVQLVLARAEGYLLAAEAVLA